MGSMSLNVEWGNRLIGVWQRIRQRECARIQALGGEGDGDGDGLSAVTLNRFELFRVRIANPKSSDHLRVRG